MGRPRIHGDHNTANTRNGQSAQNPLRAVPHQYANFVTGPNAKGYQPTRDLTDLNLHLGIAQARARPNERLAITMSGYLLLEQRGQSSTSWFLRHASPPKRRQLRTRRPPLLCDR
ncbi:hypothetical protein EMEDMD4_800041 [Sinorhizobium medicae]|uniref:Uncharacterized protein n=1 Tax=Sinorhizobium medicae TaxID=110321 RepID=A0A508X6Z1_9HYPH|nr:hypothetical protein EMEDMD4_800041 [Sinorhizobium medicae]